MNEPFPLDSWITKHAADLNTDILTHLSFVDMTPEERRFLIRMIMISVRSWLTDKGINLPGKSIGYEPDFK